MNRTLLAAIVLTAAVGVIALVVPWVLAGDRYTTELTVVATVGSVGPVTATACANGRGYARPFPGVYFILPGNAPRVLVDSDEQGSPVRVRVEVAGREVADLRAAECATLTGQVAGNGRDAHKIEGVEGRLDVACTLPDGGALTLRGDFANCFRP